MTGREYKALRLELGLTQLKLAIKLGIDPSTVARRERNEDDEVGPEAAAAIRLLASETVDAGAS